MCSNNKSMEHINSEIQRLLPPSVCIMSWKYDTYKFEFIVTGMDDNTNRVNTYQVPVSIFW